MATQLRLRLSPLGGLEISKDLTIVRDESRTAYYANGIPIGVHSNSDETARRVDMIRMIELGFASKEELSKVFGVDRSTLYRYQVRAKREGIEGLIKEKPGPKGGHRLRGALLVKAQRLLNKGTSQREVARIIGISGTAIHNAIRRGRLKQPFPRGVGRPSTQQGSHPSERNARDAKSPFGIATERTLDRVLARAGKLDEAPPEFKASMAVANGGMLLALPALLELGLLDVTENIYGSLKNGFYGLKSTVLGLAFMALLRVRNPEQMQFEAPGELGILLGLDRAPEVKTIRRKLKELSDRRQAIQLSKGLAERWVKQSSREAGLLYVDGHVRAYHGETHKLPKTHVARRRLCMPATTDYWINDKKAEPLFVVTGTANQRLISAMKEHVLPEVRRLVGKKRRVTMVFDREGWSPKWFKELYESGFDVLNYRKGKYRQWPRKLFKKVQGQVEGRKVEYELAEKKAVRVQPGFTMREVRRLRCGDRQTAILTTRKKMPILQVAWRMFERWRQENFFRYMREHFALDALVSRHVEPVEPDRMIPNPKLRKLEKKIAKKRSQLRKLEAKYGKQAFDKKETKRRTARSFKIVNEKLEREIRELRVDYQRLKARRSKMPERVAVGELNEDDRIMKFDPETKHLTDTIKMTAYRAETALFNLLEPAYARTGEEGRALVRKILRTPADIMPDEAAGLLRVRLHSLTNQRCNKAVAWLCEQLNDAQVRYPGTGLTIWYEAPNGAEIPRLCPEA